MIGVPPKCRRPPQTICLPPPIGRPRTSVQAKIQIPANPGLPKILTPETWDLYESQKELSSRPKFAAAIVVQGDLHGAPFNPSFGLSGG